MREVFDYDAELCRYHARLVAAADVRPADRVLDIGCGTGQTTRDAARAATAGRALGVDLSRPMVERARRLSQDEGVANVAFALADAQVHPFAAEEFTIGVSRFGTMFFPDPVAAFRNLRRALRPGARLVQLVWQADHHQEWSRAIRHALAGDRPPAARPGRAAFSLADPGVIAGVLTDGGFTDVDITDVRESVCYGPDADRARDAVSELRMADDLLADLDDTHRARALDRLVAVLETHDTGDGVWFDSRAWLVTATVSPAGLRTVRTPRSIG